MFSKTKEEYNKQLDNNSKIYKRIGEINSQINLKEAIKDTKIREGEPLTEVIKDINALKEEKEIMEDIIDKDKCFDLTLAKEYLNDEKNSLKEKRKLKYSEIEKKLKPLIEKKFIEIKKILDNSVSECKGDIKDFEEFIEVNSLIEPNRYQNSGSVNYLLPTFDFDSMLEEAISDYEFKTRSI